MAEYMRDVPHQKIKAGEKHICLECFHYAVCMGRVNRPCIECDNYVPAANVRENVKGKWMQVEDDEWAGGGKTVCSKCHYGYSWKMYFEAERFHFCPNCGAEMTGGNDG